MTNFSFGTFLVDASNRQAFETAQAVADLRLSDPTPILLLGDSGCGKTHLMRAIVGRVRAATRHVGLAFITARHFPDAARLLIDDPSPVQRAAGAILLVDQLEEFTDLVDELEVVTRIFLDNGHAVVFASHLHPGRLQNLTPGLKDIVNAARVVAIDPQSSETRVELLKRQFREESGDVIRRQSLEIEELRREVDRLQRDGGSGHVPEQIELERAHSRELDRRIESLEAERGRLQEELQRVRTIEGHAQDADRLHDELSRARAESAALHDQVGYLTSAAAELEDLQQRLTALEEERAHLRAQADLVEPLQREVRTLQDQLREAWAKSVYAADLEDTIARLQRDAEIATETAAERDALRAALRKSESEAARAREEANTLLGRAESLLELVESNRSRFREVEEQRSAQIADLQAQLEREREQAVPMEDLLAVKHQAEAALSQLGVERESFEETQRSLEYACAEALAKARQAEEALDSLREQHDRIEGELRSAREVRDAALRDLDDLRPANARLKEENSALRAELLDLNSRREETQQAYYDIEAARDEALAELEALRNRMTEMDAEAEQRRQRHESLEDQLAELRAEHAGLQGLFSAKARELGSLAAALNAMAAAAQTEDAGVPHPEIGGDPEVLPSAFVADDADEDHDADDTFDDDGTYTPEHQAIDFGVHSPDDDDHEAGPVIPDGTIIELKPASSEESPSETATEMDNIDTPGMPPAHSNGSHWHEASEPGAPEFDRDDPPAPERVADSLEPLQDLTPLDDERDSSI